MRLSTRLVAAALLAASVAAGPASQAGQSTDFEVELAQGDAATVESGAVAGVNPGHFAGADETYPCGDSSSPTAYCQTILVHVTNPFTEAEAKKGRERASLDLTLEMSGAGDLALLVYESDADGNRGEQVTSSDGLGESVESASVTVTTTADNEEGWFLVEVFFHAFSGTWTMDAAFA